MELDGTLVQIIDPLECRLERQMIDIVQDVISNVMERFVQRDPVFAGFDEFKMNRRIPDACL